MLRFRMVVALAAAVVVAAAGCTGVSDRRDEALDIQRQVRDMPGVSDVKLLYDNGALEGTRLELDVWMEDATDEQVAAVASMIDELRGDTFDDHDQSLELFVAPGGTINGGAQLPDNVAEISAGIRQLSRQVDAGSWDWFGTGGDGRASLQVMEASDTNRVVDAVLNVFGDSIFDTLDVRAADHGAGPNWQVRGGLTDADKQHFDSQFAAAAPALPHFVNIADGRLTQLTISIPDPATAYEDLVRVIDAFDAGRQHPVDLSWSWSGDPGTPNGPHWSGTALIGGCPKQYSGRAGGLDPEAAALQHRIRVEFDTCPE